MYLACACESFVQQMAVKSVEEFCGDFFQGNFALNKISRKLRRKLCRQTGTGLRKNLSRKMFRPARENKPRGTTTQCRRSNACAKFASTDDSR